MLLLKNIIFLFGYFMINVFFSVLEILLHFNETNDWYASLSGVMPKRFGFIVKDAPNQKPNSPTVKPPEMEMEPGKAREHSEKVEISVKSNDSQVNMVENVHCNDSAVSHAEDSHCNDSQSEVNDKETTEDKDVVIVNQIAATTEGGDVTGEDVPYDDDESGNVEAHIV